MAKYAYVVAASANYLPGYQALVGSLMAHDNWADLLLLTHGDPHAFDLPFETNFNIRRFGSSEPDQVKGTAIERFAVAVREGAHYDAICLLDCDMFLTANPSVFFDVAAKGFIVTGSNGMIINFDRAYQEQYQCFLDQESWPYPQVHTTAPIFLGPDDLNWFETLYNSRRIDSWDDFLYLNLLGIKLHKYRKMVTLPPYIFTGIHHWQVKPETSLREKGGLILSGTEEQVYMIHGKWWDEGWRSDLPLVMSRYFADEQMGDKCVQHMQAAIDLSYRLFVEYQQICSPD